jgi:hypothetical protein
MRSKPSPNPAMLDLQSGNTSSVSKFVKFV